jgi:NAD(P)-dependent dehydrogenase (short-subunit alcohol dehydrogenase family)
MAKASPGRQVRQQPTYPTQTKPNRPSPVLITGVSPDSIAGELALQLATSNPKLLILTARTEAKVSGIQSKIAASNPTVQTRFLNMDLSDLSAVRKAVDNLSDVPHIDHVVCVAGVMFPPYSTTKDGFESQLGVNYLANFVLVRLLLPKVRAAGPGSSVVVMASSMVRLGKVDFEDVNFSVSDTQLLGFELVLISCRMVKPMMLELRMASRTPHESCLLRVWERS